LPKPEQSRRRKRDDVENGRGLKEYPSFVASFISMATKRGLSKMKVHSPEFADCLPVLTVTAEHHITVLGKKLSNNSEEESPSYREYSSLQYSSRPGEAGSFFAKPVNGKIHPNDLPRIPAIVDTKNERVYAFQHGNCRLCCWNLWEGCGPDEKTALKAELKAPALSMSLLPMNKGVIYGTCTNGDIFVARVVTESGAASLSVEYLPSRQPKGTVHIGTLAEIHVDQPKVSGRKRKMSDADGNSTVVFYQLFCDGVAIKIVRHDVLFFLANSGVLIKVESLLQNVASLNLIEIHSETMNRAQLTRAELLISSSGSSPRVSVVYTIGPLSNIPDEPRTVTFCAALSLASANFSHTPVRLPSSANQFGLVTETVLSTACKDTVCLYDLVTGSLLQVKPLQHLLPSMDSDWVLKSDTKHGLIAVFYSKQGYLHAAFSTASLDGAKGSLAAMQLKSSAKLTGSLLVTSRKNAKSLDRPTADIIDESTMVGDIGVDKVYFYHSVPDLLSILDEQRRTLCLSSKNTAEMSFNEVFDMCISRLRGDTDDFRSAPNGESATFESRIVTPHNPQDPSGPDCSNPYLVVESPKKENAKSSCCNTLNGKCFPSDKPQQEKPIPPCVPQMFIDGAVEITMSAIKYDKESKSGMLSKLGVDARSILKRLLRTGRVSARRHFEGSYPLQETSQKHPLIVALRNIHHSQTNENPLSSVQLIIEMLECCSDLSERQLVILMDYMIRFPQADEIAKAFEDIKKRKTNKEYTVWHSKQGRLEKVATTCAADESARGQTRKLVMEGVEMLMYKVVCYSECNEVMLRVALSEGLSSGAEAVIMVHLLSNLLKSKPSIIRPQKRLHPSFVRSLCQWIAALGESFKAELKEAKTSSGENCITFLLNSLREANRNSQAIISMKDCIGIAEAKKKNMAKRARIRAAERGITGTSTEENFPGYSIDRIIF